ncbi:hypothetical protein L2E82_16031 [Cichorium intybus]|uniref:Uncharacterized protein n=1 Tax=Cichorium intybus TaxID=13427 RepID=A0ACB9F3Y0_CICIN|nr:hypothetical protein L2E82_16031 [Cichorium intybus]
MKNGDGHRGFTRLFRQKKVYKSRLATQKCVSEGGILPVINGLEKVIEINGKIREGSGHANTITSIRSQVSTLYSFHFSLDYNSHFTLLTPPPSGLRFGRFPQPSSLVSRQSESSLASSKIDTLSIPTLPR